MLTWIVAHSDALCNFLTPLLIGFSPAQLRHALNCIEALLVCTSKHKTLSALTRLLRLPHADEFALADFIRASPWESAPIQKAVTLFLLCVVCTIQQRTGWRLLFLRIDDALCPKDVATAALEAVTFHCDHSQPRRQKGKFTNSSRYVTLGLQLGPVQFVLAWRLYLPRKLIKQLNRTRTRETPLTFAKLPTLVEQMLDDNCPALAQGLSRLCTVRCVVRQSAFAEENPRARLSLDVCDAFQSQCVRPSALRCIADLVRQGHSDDELLDLLVPD